MNYKVAYDLFQRLLQREQGRRKETIFSININEAFGYMGIIQAKLGNEKRLIPAEYELTLSAGVNRYEVANNPSQNQLPVYILDIRSITYKGANSQEQLRELTPEEIEKADRNSNSISGWCFYGKNNDRVLILNATPTSSEDKLLIKYYQKVYEFLEDGTNNNITWSDFDLEKANYGGEFKIPSEYHNLIVEGAITMLFPDLYEKWVLEVEKLFLKRPKHLSWKLEYKLGG